MGHDTATERSAPVNSNSKGANMHVEVRIANAFIDGPTGGNPAGVVLDANGMSPDQKLAVARQVGLSDTAFISRSDSATVKLEFFTPTRQIAHCGHATVAAFSVMRQLGMIGDGKHSKETIDGNRDVLVDGTRAYMEQRAPTYTRIPARSEIGTRAMAALGLSTNHLREGLDPWVVNTGNGFLLVPLADDRVVAGLRPDLAQVDAVSESLDLIGVYAFSLSTRQPGRHAGARMFAPRFGISEEPGTGMAAGPLASFLHDHMGIRDHHVRIEQGWLMPEPSPSVIDVVLEFDGVRISRLTAGGEARITGSRWIELWTRTD
jgi:PhzF family phenazine biosynthesis protein